MNVQCSARQTAPAPLGTVTASVAGARRCKCAGVFMLSLEELRKKVCLVANAIDALELPKGSAIAIDMPMDVT
uniref:Uncharacterized protein n=1 Tax=Zea mays TaxID=4577 RepID=A0A804MJL5_MAIZE